MCKALCGCFNANAYPRAPLPGVHCGSAATTVAVEEVPAHVCPLCAPPAMRRLRPSGVRGCAPCRVPPRRPVAVATRAGAARTRWRVPAPASSCSLAPMSTHSHVRDIHGVHTQLRPTRHLPPFCLPRACLQGAGPRHAARDARRYCTIGCCVIIHSRAARRHDAPTRSIVKAISLCFSASRVCTQSAILLPHLSSTLLVPSVRHQSVKKARPFSRIERFLSCLCRPSLGTQRATPLTGTAAKERDR